MLSHFKPVQLKTYFYTTVSQHIFICNPEVTEYPLLLPNGYNDFGTWMLFSSESYFNGSVDNQTLPTDQECTVSMRVTALMLTTSLSKGRVVHCAVFIICYKGKTPYNSKNDT